jgi:hypothetical protein
MEEAPAILAVVDRLAQQGGYPDELESLSEERAADLRVLYFEQVEQALQRDPGRRLVDKSPLHTAHLGLIQRLFPGAPLVMMVRHPLDVCLSCFMQDFTLSPFMTRFLELRSTAEVYVEVMTLGERYRQLLPLNLHQLRYEDLVEDFDGEVRRLLAFLDLPWQDRLAEFDRHARDRGLINTPSYHQVSQPIYQAARRRWVRYRQQLSPIIPLLQSCVDGFGYSLDEPSVDD